MAIWSDQIRILPPRKGLHEITNEIAKAIQMASIQDGLCHVFIQHTSASLALMENADPSAQRDLESYMDHIAPPNMSFFTHTLEGDDDMPSHIKTVLSSVSISLPISGGRLALGTWQGLFLWEHREQPQNRRIHITLIS